MNPKIKGAQSNVGIKLFTSLWLRRHKFGNTHLKILHFVPNFHALIVNKLPKLSIHALNFKVPKARVKSAVTTQLLQLYA